MPTNGIDSGVLTQIKEHYSEDILDIIFEDGKLTSPTFASCELAKRNDGMGRGYVERVVTSEGSAVAADASIADTINGDGSAGGRPSRDRWVIQAVNMDAPFGFTRDEILSIEGMGADEQFDTITDEMDKAVIRIRNALAQQCPNKGWGMLALTTAQSSTGFTVPTYLANRFKVGDRLVASVSEDTDVLLNSATQLRVTGVNAATGVITTSANPTSSWASNATLYIFRAGMRITTDPSADQSVKTCISGLRSWIDPDATDALFGVTRSGDPTKLGLGVDCTNMDTAQGLIEIADRLFHFGRKADTILCSGVSWKLLQQDYDPSRLVSVSMGDYQIGFEGYKLATVFGSCVVVPDPFIDGGTAFVGPFQNKKLRPKMIYSGDKLISLDNFDGLDFQRDNSSGNRKFKGQFFFRGNMSVAAPGCYAKGTNLPTS